MNERIRVLPVILTISKKELNELMNKEEDKLKKEGFDILGYHLFKGDTHYHYAILVSK